jgi:hypothetical protein
MWIMLIKKLATDPSPPKFSIFWSTPWLNMHYVRPQLEDWLRDRDFPEMPKRGYSREYYVELLTNWAQENDLDENFFFDDSGKLLSEEVIESKLVVVLSKETIISRMMGRENNWAGARKIHYKDTDIRVFPDEFSVMTDEKMALYTGLQEDASHDLVPSSVADATLIQEVLSGSLKEIFDAAKVDGATDEQARAMAFGVDVSDQAQIATLPAIGWYRCRREYSEALCTEQEMKE